ncbi:MAG TPA: hypothetical protein VMT46_11640 [Anaerolineaceae bacterium]|nr:hypothetical protein [Anaerolineaceae bacterium]
MHEEMVAIQNTWDSLQQPAHPGQGMSASFRFLLAAIDQGWQVEQPVRKVPMVRQEAWMYHFVLVQDHSERIRQLAVPEAPEVDQFLRSNEVRVEKFDSWLDGLMTFSFTN